MYNDPAAWDRINSFALVSYIPEPLAGFLDRLRQELVPNCCLRAHVTILPPRPISTTPEAAWELIRRVAPQFSPFEVDMSVVEVFPVSDVIHVDIGRGRDELQKMHDALDIDGLQYKEPYPFHPHITLAQDLKGDEVDELVHVARARWAECNFPRKFCVDTVFFVQNTRRKEWIDLGRSALGHAESHLVGDLVDLMV